jgi:hypothetical protein
VAAYFSEVLIDVNLVFRWEPMPLTTAMMASEIPAAINPYSIAVARRSRQRRIFEPMRSWGWTVRSNQ